MYDQKVKQMACGERVDDVFSEQMAMVVSQEAVELYMDPARCPEAMRQYNGSFLVHGRKGYVMYRERRVASAKSVSASAISLDHASMERVYAEERRVRPQLVVITCSVAVQRDGGFWNRGHRASRRDALPTISFSSTRAGGASSNKLDITCAQHPREHRATVLVHARRQGDATSRPHTTRRLCLCMP